jgi:hypothetical protein
MEREMEKICLDLTAIVVGSPRRNFVEQAASHLAHTNISYEICEDVYSAAAIMANAPAGKNLLIVGCFAALMVENMRLFSLSPKDKKVFFCCIMEKWFQPLQSSLLAAAKTGVFIVNSAEQIADVIEQCTNASSIVRQKTGGRDFTARIGSLADSFFLTQAEQDALLGIEHDTDAAKSVFTE